VIDSRNAQNEAVNYNRATVPSATTSKIVDMRTPQTTGFFLKLGISDVTAWGTGSYFTIVHNGREWGKIEDQIADLLNQQFIALDLAENDRLEIHAYNATAGALDFAAVVTII